MNARKKPGTDDRKYCHRFSKAVNACTPALTQQKENGRDQSARVTDADPEDKVRDVEGPTNRPIEPPGTDPRLDLIADRDDAGALLGAPATSAMEVAKGTILRAI